MNKINPLLFFSPQRMDLVVKYLFARSFFENWQNKEIESLYLRHILLRTLGSEPINDFNCIQKDGLESYKSEFEKLCLSMHNNGYDANFPVPIDVENHILNGAHRVAVAKALNLDVCTEIFDKKAQTWNFDWFCQKGFLLEDKMRILKTFVELQKNKTSILLVWQPVLPYWEQIKSLIKLQNLEIVGDIDLSFEDNYNGFQNVLFDIYEVYGINKNKKNTIAAKADLLSSVPLNFKVVVLLGEDVHSKTLDLKQKIRMFFDHKIPKEIFATVHSSDGERECYHLAQILLSPNNLKYVRCRQESYITEEFLQKCEQIKSLCSQQNFALQDVCVVSSMVMELLGIRKAGDIDLIVKHNQKFQKFPHSIDIQCHYARYTELSDDALIDDDDNYFYFNGLKFVNINIVEKRKTFQARKKDLLDVRKIKLWQHCYHFFDKDKMLFAKIEQELVRRGLVKSKKNIFIKCYWWCIYHFCFGKKRKQYKSKFLSYK